MFNTIRLNLNFSYSKYNKSYLPNQIYKILTDYKTNKIEIYEPCKLQIKDNNIINTIEYRNYNLNIIKGCNSAFYIHNSLTSSNLMFKLGYIYSKYPNLPIFIGYHSTLYNNLPIYSKNFSPNILYFPYNDNNLGEFQDELYNWLDIIAKNNNIK